VKNKINLIYGGGSVGLMGTVAKTVADGGCDVTGFLPEFFVTRSKPSKNDSLKQLYSVLRTFTHKMFPRTDFLKTCHAER